MNINILAVGDVAGTAGLNILTDSLRGMQKFYDVTFTVVNGENASITGTTATQAQAILDAGADVITLGNHTWGKRDLIPMLNDCDRILRPANYAPQVPGRGWGAFETDFGVLCVINLIGRCDMPFGSENPFLEADRILKKLDTDIILVDFHAEATSEKLALAYYLDGRVSALWGTHTHVQTSDACVFGGGMGYITDLGMTGACDSILGVKPEQSVSRFLGNPPIRYEAAGGASKIEGAIFEINVETGRCVSAEAIRVM